MATQKLLDIDILNEKQFKNAYSKILEGNSSKPKKKIRPKSMRRAQVLGMDISNRAKGTTK